MSTIKRVAQLRKLKPESVNTYVEMHKNVWPELEEVYKQHGVTDISCYVKDSYLVVTIETDPEIYNRKKDDLARHPVELKWQEIMAGFDDPDFAPVSLDEVYRLV